MLHALLRPRPLGAALLAGLVVRYRARRGRDAPPGLRPPIDPVRRTRLARDVLHGRDGALADERDRHWVGADAVARGPGRGVGGAAAGSAYGEKSTMTSEQPNESDEIILEPGAWSRDELDELAQSIRGVAPGLAVRYAVPSEQRGYAVTWWEVVHIWLPWAALAAGGVVGPAIVKKIVDVVIEWARTRFARKSNRRPKYVAIYGPDGRVVQSVLISNETAPPEDRTATDAANPRRHRPSLSED